MLSVAVRLADCRRGEVAARVQDHRVRDGIVYFGRGKRLEDRKVRGVVSKYDDKEGGLAGH